MMRTSKLGVGFIYGNEAGFLYGYPDPGPTGRPVTDGFGHTAAAGGRVPVLGKKISLTEAFRQGREDLRGAESRVNRVVRVQLTQAQFDALVDFEHNTGAISSGTVDDLLNDGKVDAALAVLGQYIKAKGKVLPGLVTRRREDIDLFRTGRYPSRAILIRDAPGSPGRSISVASIPWDDAPPEVPPVLDRSALAPLPPVELPPMPIRKPTPPAGNFIVDLAAYIWSFWK